MPDGSLLVVTTAVDLDRTGHSYGGKLIPDQLVDAAATITSDPTQSAAHAWLAESCGH